MVSFLPRENSPSQITSWPPTQNHEFVCEGIDDHETVRMLGFQTTPSAIATGQGILYRQDVAVTRQGHQLYYVSVPYSRQNLFGIDWDFDTSGASVNVKASRQLVASYVAAGEVIKDHKGAINRQLDGTIEGVDIVIPSMRINVRFTHPLGVVTFQFARAMRALTGKVNSTSLFGFAPGEVLFLGARGSDGNNTDAQVSYSFAIEENIQSKVIGGITLAKKDGHDYAWIEFKHDIDGGQAVTVPRQIDVCRVYERVDLAAAFGFGGA